MELKDWSLRTRFPAMGRDQLTPTIRPRHPQSLPTFPPPLPLNQRSIHSCSPAPALQLNMQSLPRRPSPLAPHKSAIPCKSFARLLNGNMFEAYDGRASMQAGAPQQRSHTALAAAARESSTIHSLAHPRVTVSEFDEFLKAEGSCMLMWG